MRITPTDTPWHNSLVERHGQVLGETVEASVEACQIEGYDEMKLVTSSAASAKNRGPDRTGYSARSKVFGTEERWPGAVIDDVLGGESPAELHRAVSDPWFKRALDMRTAAQMSLTALDADDRWKRAITTGPTGDVQMWSPGAQLFYWRRARTTGNSKSRRSRISERWRGPAVVLGQVRREESPDPA